VNLDKQVTGGRSSNDYRVESGQQGHEEAAWMEDNRDHVAISAARKVERAVLALTSLAKSNACACKRAFSLSFISRTET
tara:strand:+ start:264 stop:500 length:237 start_codon:yes stop_codon:yes gene_type:complete